MLRRLIGAIILAAIALAVFEYFSPKYFGRGLHDKAVNVASAGAHKIFTEHNSRKPFDEISREAHKASEDRARKDGVTLTAWNLSPQNEVQVTIGKQAPSLVLKYWNGKYDEMSRTVSVAPQ